MNDRINKFLLAGETFISEMHLRQPGFIGHLLKTKKESKSSKKTGVSRFIYKDELDKPCFQLVFGSRRF